MTKKDKSALTLAMLPGAADELRASGNSLTVDRAAEMGITPEEPLNATDHHWMICLRVDDSDGRTTDEGGSIIPGSVTDHACKFCLAKVYTAPSGQAALKMYKVSISCLRCMGRIEDDEKPN